MAAGDVPSVFIRPGRGSSRGASGSLVEGRRPQSVDRVMPAKAGIQSDAGTWSASVWTPAFAGVTKKRT